MTARPSRTRPKKKDPRELKVAQQPTETPAATLARTMLRPTVQAAITVYELLKPHCESLEITPLVDELAQQVKATTGGDLSRMEAMLTAQAQTLDSLFHRMTRQAVGNIGHYPETVERYMKLALRAQSQARATAETLNELKNPRPVAFVQQANIAHGPQQVNNGSAGADFQTSTRARAYCAGNSENAQNELMEQPHGERLDTGTAGTAGGAYSPMETVGALHRPEDPGR